MRLAVLTVVPVFLLLVLCSVSGKKPQVKFGARVAQARSLCSDEENTKCRFGYTYTENSGRERTVLFVPPRQVEDDENSFRKGNIVRVTPQKVTSERTKKKKSRRLNFDPRRRQKLNQKEETKNSVLTQATKAQKEIVINQFSTTQTTSIAPTPPPTAPPVTITIGGQSLVIPDFGLSFPKDIAQPTRTHQGVRGFISHKSRAERPTSKKPPNTQRPVTRKLTIVRQSSRKRKPSEHTNSPKPQRTTLTSTIVRPAQTQRTTATNMRIRPAQIRPAQTSTSSPNLDTRITLLDIPLTTFDDLKSKLSSETNFTVSKFRHLKDEPSTLRSRASTATTFSVRTSSTKTTIIKDKGASKTSSPRRTNNRQNKQKSSVKMKQGDREEVEECPESLELCVDSCVPLEDVYVYSACVVECGRRCEDN